MFEHDLCVFAEVEPDDEAKPFSRHASTFCIEHAG
jgi:hypothetical protein